MRREPDWCRNRKTGGGLHRRPDERRRRHSRAARGAVDDERARVADVMHLQQIDPRRVWLRRAVRHRECDLELVLDQQRHCISVFDKQGTYLTEFGGMGTSPGWFYFPGG